MDGHSFLIFADFVNRERDAVATLREEAARSDVRCTEAWFMSMAMGHPGASDEDEQRARDILAEANSAQEVAGRAVEDATRRLEYYEAFLKQCTPGPT